MLQEWHYFFQNTLRWRNLRKITIAQVHGTVFAAGLMLMWCCDLIVAADDAEFADVVGTRLGMCGVEYFAHPWEFGPRKTKELMLTGDSLDVDEAHQLGMVSKVFPTDELAEQTLEFARRIAGPADHDRAADQGVGQPDRRQHGLLQRPPGLLHPPPAQPLPLGRGPREQDAGGPARGRDRQLAGGAADRARPQGSGEVPAALQGWCCCCSRSRTVSEQFGQAWFIRLSVLVADQAGSRTLVKPASRATWLVENGPRFADCDPTDVGAGRPFASSCGMPDCSASLLTLPTAASA